MEVVANPRYEKPRAPWTGYKRPTHALNGRQVHPRLVHENPTDDISGLGRRKIPTSSQKPDRKSNVGIRYTRVIDTTAASLSTSVNVGDLLFVGKTTTLFGSGVNRVSAVLSLGQINERLDKEDCLLKKPPDSDIIAFWDVKRRQSYVEFATAWYDFADSRRSGKTMGSDGADELQQLRDKFDCFDASSFYANFTPDVYPMLPQLSDWSLDGVLVSRDDDSTVSAQLIPSIQDSQTILSVGVGGPCEVRNMLHSKSPQFFGSKVDSQDDLFVNLVSRWGGEGFKYRYYVTSRTRMLNVMHNMIESTSQDDFGIDELFSTVAAYRVGKVIDTNSVAHGERKLTVNLAITSMDFYDFWKHLTSGDPLEEWKARHTRLNNKRAKQRWLQAKLARVRGMASPPTTATQRVRNLIPLIYFAQFLGLAANNIMRMMNAPYRQVLIPAPQNVTGDLSFAPREDDVDIIEQADAALEAAEVDGDQGAEDVAEIDTGDMVAEQDQNPADLRLAGEEASSLTIEDSKIVRGTLRAIQRLYSEGQTDDIKLFLERLVNVGLSGRPLIETVREQASARARLPLEFKLRPIMTSSRDAMMYAFATQISSAVRERRLSLQNPKPLTIAWMKAPMVVKFESGLSSLGELPPTPQLPAPGPLFVPPSGIPRMPSNLTGLTSLVTKAMYDARLLDADAIQRIPMANNMMLTNGIYTSMQEVITSVIDDNDFDSVCGTFDITQDNGLKRELCRILSQSGQFGPPQTSNGIVSFELTDAQKGANGLEIDADLTPAYDLITGTFTAGETDQVMSDALNFLFRMQFTEDWTPSVTAGRWGRTLEDYSTSTAVASAVQFLGNAVYNTASSVAVIARDVAPIIVGALATGSGLVDSGMSQRSLAVMSTEVLQDPQGMQLMTQFTTPANMRQGREASNVFSVNISYQLSDMFKEHSGPEITPAVLEFMSEYRAPSNPTELLLPDLPQEFRPYPVPESILNSPMYNTYEIPQKLMALPALPAPPSASPAPPSASPAPLAPNASVAMPRPIPSPSPSSSVPSAPQTVTPPKPFGEKLYAVLQTVNNTSPEDIVKGVRAAVEGHTVDELMSEIPKIDNDGVRDLVKERVSVLTYDEAAAEQNRVGYGIASGVLSLAKRGLNAGLEMGLEAGGKFVLWNLDSWAG